jgi:hypothetical protein
MFNQRDQQSRTAWIVRKKQDSKENPSDALTSSCVCSSVDASCVYGWLFYVFFFFYHKACWQIFFNGLLQYASRRVSLRKMRKEKETNVDV